MTIHVDPDWWQTLFDEVYLTTDARSVCDENLTRREVDLLARLVPLNPDHRILDLCGGHGRHTLELCRQGYTRCTVFDYSQPLLEKGRQATQKENYPVEFVQGDARDTGLPSAYFDHVFILGNSLGYIAKANADLAILMETKRVLKNGGRLLLDVTDGDAVRARFTPNAWHEIGTDVVVCRWREINQDMVSVREMVLDKLQGLIRDCNYCIRLYTAAELKRLACEAGFANVAVHTHFDHHLAGQDLGFMNHRMLLTGQKQ